ncbi:hypothetical protein K661_01670 [Piscirickettsia salmonis LF-89 = ATCC VR-1361]|nr:hypothetical protein K661_01670 [Piscirickettsia salmonis LF-89 = ATCC VR-1361]
MVIIALVITGYFSAFRCVYHLKTKWLSWVLLELNFLIK